MNVITCLNADLEILQSNINKTENRNLIRLESQITVPTHENIKIQSRVQNIFTQIIIILILSITYKPAISAIQSLPLTVDEKNSVISQIHSFRSQSPHPCSIFNETAQVIFEENLFKLSELQNSSDNFASSTNQYTNPNSLPFPRYAISNNGHPVNVLNESFFTNYCAELMDISLSGSNIVVNMARSWNSIDNKTYWVLKVRKDTIFNELLPTEHFGREFSRGWALVNKPLTPIGKRYNTNRAFRYNERYESSPFITDLSINPVAHQPRAIPPIGLATKTWYNSVTRMSDGLYLITFPNFAITTHVNKNTGETTLASAGIVHVTAVGGNHSCKVYEQRVAGNDLQLAVACFKPDGSYTNGKFSVLSYKDGVKWTLGGQKITRHGSGYVFVGSPESKMTYTPRGVFQYNSRGYQFPDPVGGTPNKVTRIAEGYYRVRMPNMNRHPLESDKGGTLSVTAYGYGALRCKAKDWRTNETDVVAHVLCYNVNGELADSKFALSYMREAGALAIRNAGDKKEGFYVWGGINRVQKHSFFQSDAYGGSSATSEAIAKGVYKVYLPGVQSKKTSNVQVTAYGSNSNYCNVAYWKKDLQVEGTVVKVTCFETKGSPADSNFSLQYYTDNTLKR